MMVDLACAEETAVNRAKLKLETFMMQMIWASGDKNRLLSR